MEEIDRALYIEGLDLEEDLTTLALYRLLQRYFSERGTGGFNNIVRLWAYLIKKEEEKEEEKADKINKIH